MKIDRLVLGAYETNCYVLRTDQFTRQCLIVDTGLEITELLNFLEQNQLSPAAVLLTHGHIDHISGIVELRKCCPKIRVYIHKLDAEMLTDAETNLSGLEGKKFSTDPADFYLKEGDVISEAGIELEVLHTPGHTPGGICLYSKAENNVFVGDCLFAGSVGRTDFPNSSRTDLIKSIKEKLFLLPEDTEVFPGHGPTTTIAREKANNPFLR